MLIFTLHCITLQYVKSTKLFMARHEESFLEVIVVIVINDYS